MPPFRIPFTKKSATLNSSVYHNNENVDPNTKDKPSVALGMKEKKDEPNEFKLSCALDTIQLCLDLALTNCAAVTDNGEYMPPSPVEQRSFWGTSKSPSAASTTHRSVFSQDEPFSISRESFDSYRRSFDVTGRSPIIHSDSYTSRTSLDSRNARLPRPALNGTTFDKPQNTPKEEGDFEDVGLNDDPAKAQQPKRRGFLSRFADSKDSNTNTSEDGKSHHFHILPGRKRGQSGTGSELGNMADQSNRPMSKGKAEVAAL